MLRRMSDYGDDDMDSACGYEGTMGVLILAQDNRLRT